MLTGNLNFFGLFIIPRVVPNQKYTNNDVYSKQEKFNKCRPFSLEFSENRSDSADNIETRVTVVSSFKVHRA